MRWGYWTCVVIFSFCLGILFGSRELFSKMLKPKLTLICKTEECFPETLKQFKKSSGIQLLVKTYNTKEDLNLLLTKDFDLLLCDRPLDVDSDLFINQDASQLVDVNFRFPQAPKALPFAWSIRDPLTQQKLHIVFLMLKKNSPEQSSAQHFLEFITTRGPLFLNQYSKMKTPFVGFEDSQLPAEDKASALRNYPLNHLKIEFIDSPHGR